MIHIYGLLFALERNVSEECVTLTARYVETST